MVIKPYRTAFVVYKTTTQHIFYFASWQPLAVEEETLTEVSYRFEKKNKTKHMRLIISCRIVDRPHFCEGMKRTSV